MRYGQIRALDVANGEGIRVSLFVTGCYFNCEGCFNPEYQCFEAGELYTATQTKEIIDYLNKPTIKGITILGGEPFQNEVDLLPVVQEIRQFIDQYNLLHQDDRSYNAHKNIWIYSGYTFEELIQHPSKKALLELCDVLVDGRFILKQLNLKLRFRGSSNQRILDVKKSLLAKSPVLYLE